MHRHIWHTMQSGYEPWRQGNKEHTEHEYYHVDRAGGIEFEHVPTDCSRKIGRCTYGSNRTIWFSKMLCHFRRRILPDMWQTDMMWIWKNVWSVQPIGSGKVRKMLLERLSKGYQTVTTTNRQINIMSAQYWYAMYPVWGFKYDLERRKIYICHEWTDGKDGWRSSGRSRCFLEICRT